MLDLPVSIFSVTTVENKPITWICSQKEVKKAKTTFFRFYINGEPSVSISHCVQLVYHTNQQNQEQHLTYICKRNLILISSSLSQYDNQQFTLAACKNTQPVKGGGGEGLREEDWRLGGEPPSFEEAKDKTNEINCGK